MNAKFIVGAMSAKFLVKSINVGLPWRNDGLTTCQNYETICLQTTLRGVPQIVGSSPVYNSSQTLKISFPMPAQLWKEKIREILLTTFSGSVWSSKQSKAFKLQAKRYMENRNLFYSDVFYPFTATKYKYKIRTSSNVYLK